MFITVDTGYMQFVNCLAMKNCEISCNKLLHVTWFLEFLETFSWQSNTWPK